MSPGRKHMNVAAGAGVRGRHEVAAVLQPGPFGIIVWHAVPDCGRGLP